MAADIPLGMIGGYTGGRIDNLVNRFIDMFMSFSIVILGLLVLAIMSPGLIKIVIAIALAITPRIARLARGSTLAIFLSVFSFNLIADDLRDISDPKLRG